MNRDRLKHVLPLFLLLALAIGLRLWGLDIPPGRLGDEAAQVPAGQNFLKSGHADSFWHHPHFGLLLLAGGIELLGDGPYGWRARNVVLGGLSILLIYLIALELSGRRRTAFIAGFLAALDPQHILLSRTTFDEVPATFFFLCAFYPVLRYLKGLRSFLLPAGIAFGFSLASKSYYAFCLVILIFYVSAYRMKQENAGRPGALNVGLTFVLVPAVVYALSYMPWFGRGYGPAEFLQLMRDSQNDLRHLTPLSFKTFFVMKEGGSPITWFALPKIFGYEIQRSGDHGIFLVLMNNPPIWLLTWPSAVYFGYRAFRDRERLHLFWMLMFTAAYLPLLLLQRPIFLYSSLPLLPFAFIFIAFSIEAAAGLFQRGKLFYTFICVFIFLWSIYCYPLVTFRSVPLSVYQPLLSSIRIFNGYWACE